MKKDKKSKAKTKKKQANIGGADPVVELPNEISSMIFEKLDPPAVASCCLVSHTWKRFADSDRVWKSLVEDLIGTSTMKQRGQDKEGLSWKEIYRAYVDNDELFQPNRIIKSTDSGGAGQEIKLAVSGAGGVGKSTFVIMFIAGHFVEEYDPTIEDSYRKRVCVDGMPLLLDILDTAGQEEYSAMRDRWIRTTEGFIHIYSTTDRNSLDMNEKVLRIKDDSNVPCILVGNKIDLVDQRQVSRKEGQALAHQLGLPFIETSVKQRINVEEAFLGIVRLVLRKRNGGAQLVGKKGKGKRAGTNKDNKRCRIM